MLAGWRFRWWYSPNDLSLLQDPTAGMLQAFVPVLTVNDVLKISYQQTDDAAYTPARLEGGRE